MRKRITQEPTPAAETVRYKKPYQSKTGASAPKRAMRRLIVASRTGLCSSSITGASLSSSPAPRLSLITSREWTLQKRRSPRLMRRAGFSKLITLAGGRFRSYTPPEKSSRRARPSPSLATPGADARRDARPRACRLLTSRNSDCDRWGQDPTGRRSREEGALQGQARCNYHSENFFGRPMAQGIFSRRRRLRWGYAGRPSRLLP